MTQTNPELVAFYTREFGHLERLHRAGSSLALVEAFHCCLSWGAVPRWFLRAAGADAALSLRGRPSKKAGRAASGLSRDRAYLKRLVHFDSVETLREAQEGWRRELTILKGLAWTEKVQFHIDRLEGQIREFGGTLDDICHTIHRELAKTWFAASADSVRSNYYRVKRDMKELSTATLYYAYSQSALRAAGIEPPPF